MRALFGSDWCGYQVAEDETPTIREEILTIVAG
jgi:hypothetical protein